MNIFISLIVIGLSIFIGYQLCLVGNAQRQRAKKQQELLLKPTDSTPKTAGLLEKTIMFKEVISVLKQLSQNISSYLNLNDLTKEIVATTHKILNTEICVVFILDETKEELSIFAATGIENAIIPQVRVKKGEEISGIAAKYNEVIVINDWEYKKELYNLKYEKFYKNSLVSLPLSVKDRVLGVLNVSNKKAGNNFTPDDIQILNLIAFEGAIAIQNFKLYEELQENYLKTIFALANTIDAKDPYTRRHSQNVAKYAVAIAEEMKLPLWLIENIKHASLLHDIGKIAIKDAILKKPERLLDEEYLQIKVHSSKGEEIIKSLPFLKEEAKIIRHHHERFDGKGYPDGLKGEDIELGARIVAVADFFDAITSDRPYRKALGLDEVKSELNKNKGTQFDPTISNCLLKILEKNPTLINNPL